MGEIDQAPYFDDFNPDKNFTRVLFKPGEAVQARELNQVQSIWGDQFSSVTDRVLASSALLSGCGVTTNNNLAYVKIRDNNTFGQPVDLSRFTSKQITNASGTRGTIVATGEGSESAAPNLNTLFVTYTGAGASGNAYSFTANEILTISDPSFPVERVRINNGSSGFNNGDSIEFLSALRVTDSNGNKLDATDLYVGDRIFDGQGANVIVTAISEDASATLVSVRPQHADLVASNTVSWTISTDTTLQSANTAQSFLVVDRVGAGATASLKVNGIGRISEITITNPGSGYTVAPTAIAVSATATSAQQTALNIVAENFVDLITVADTAFSPIGKGFAVEIGEGKIYQSGSVIRTQAQLVIVNRYEPTATGVSVGFETTPSIVTAKDDPTLYDNALGYSNYQAPGADRQKKTATASAVDIDVARNNPHFLSIVEFSDGEPVIVEPPTQSDLVDQHLALRTYEESGNFVIDRFLVTTRGLNLANTNTVQIAVDPGTAYVDGYRVSTDRNYLINANKGTGTKSFTSVEATVSYGNYIECSSMFGIFTRDSVITLSPATLPLFGASFSAPATSLGTARIRGIKGVTANGQTLYRVYLYDVALAPGASFNQVRSFVQTGVGGANISSASNYNLFNTEKSRAIFNTPVKAVKSISAVSYTYQKTNWGTINTTLSGTLSVTLSAPEDSFATAGSITGDALRNVLVSPQANIISTTNGAGSIATTAASNTVVGSGTSFLTDAPVGSFIHIGNSTANVLAQVVNVANNTSLTLSPAPAFSNATATYRKAIPANITLVPSSASVSPDLKTLTVNLGVGNTSAVGVSIVTDVVHTPTVSSKAVTRNAVARLTLNAAVGGTVGPWPVGHSDVIRLRGVYKGTSNTFTSSTGADVTDHFYIDSNQTPDSRGTGYLYLRNAGSLPLATTDRLLVVMDILTQTGTELVTRASYPINDSVVLANATASIHTVELPEVSTPEYFDTRDAFDFRPAYANTISVSTTQSSAPLNPTEPVYANRYASGLLYPSPESVISCNVEQYVGRTDRVVATAGGSIQVITGQDGGATPAAPPRSITLEILDIPPYPTLPVVQHAEMATYLDRRIASERYANKRVVDYTIKQKQTEQERNEQQPRGYAMKDIGAIDRRVANLENYVALSLAELKTQKRSIRNADGERFKFGFFVDSFDDLSVSDTENPGFRATIEGGRLIPYTNREVVPLNLIDSDTVSGGVASIPYTSQVLAEQTIATYVPEVIEPEPVDPGTQEPPAYRQKRDVVFFYNLNTMTSNSGSVFETRSFTFSRTDGPAELYVNFRDNKEAVEIHQSTVENFTPTAATLLLDGRAAQRLTDYDKSVKAYDMGKLEQLNAPVWAGSPPRPAIEDSGKILWTHKGAKGRFYKIIIWKYRKSGSASGWKGLFRCRLFYPTDEIVPFTYVPPVASLNNGYVGTMTVAPSIFEVGTDRQSNGQYGYYILPQKIDVTVSGLKPQTQHNVVFSGVNANANAQPAGGSLGDPLISSASGTLTFSVFVGADIPTATSAGLLDNLITSSYPTTQSIVVSSADGYSTAGFVIPPRGYVASSNIATGGGFGGGGGRIDGPGSKNVNLV